MLGRVRPVGGRLDELVSKHEARRLDCLGSEPDHVQARQAAPVSDGKGCTNPILPRWASSEACSPRAPGAP